MQRRRRLLVPLAVVVVTVVAVPLAACGAGTSTTSADAGALSVVTTADTGVNTSDLGGRPASPVHVRIVSPSPGATVTGPTMHVVVAIDGGTVTSQVSRNISPTQGHVHLYVDSVLIYMAYQLQQDVPVQPGTFKLQAEFVAADHAPFNPRVITSELVTVTP